MTAPAITPALIELAKAAEKRAGLTIDEFFDAFCESVRNERRAIEFFVQALAGLDNIDEAYAAYAKVLEESL